MERPNEIRCRVVACPEALDDGKEWSFYVINDGDAPLDSVVLKRFGHEWGDGDVGHSTDPNVTVSDLAPGHYASIWRDNDEELRMWMTLEVHAGTRMAEVLIEFPMLYRRRSGAGLPIVEGLGKCGYVRELMVGSDG
jgi:hypothetical protein